MWIRLSEGADPSALKRELQGLGLWVQALEAPGGGRGFMIDPSSRRVAPEVVERLPGVAEVFAAPSPHPKVDAQSGQTVRVGSVDVGDAPVLAAGPCGVESRAQIDTAAAMVADAGGRLLRGGAFKPRTSPYSFTGHGREALGWLRDAADRHGLGVVTEVMSELDVEAVAEAADLLQIGTRNMQNFALLRAVGAAGKPVLLKRGRCATVEEWLLAGEHVLAAGASGVIFCERGVRGFDPQTRNLLDLGAVALLAEVYRQPVWVDPSHATGRRDLLTPLARAGLAAGACGLLIEAHPDAREAQSDGPQALDARELAKVAGLCGAAACTSSGER